MAAEAVLILSLLLAWVLIPGVREDRSLVVLFFYSFPSEFLVGLVPHEPVLLFYGAHHPALTVALVAGVGTVLAEGLNYSFLGFFNDLRLFAGVSRRPMVTRIRRLFGRAPFLAILVAGFTPVPFFPIRFLVVMEGYPIARYLLGVFLSRTPRFLLLAALGHVIRFPAWFLVALFVALAVALYRPLFGREGP